MKITENYKNELANQEVRLKIEKSKEQNMKRIQRMRKVNEYVEELKKETRNQIREKMKSDKDAYKELLKNLLIQVSSQDIAHIGLYRDSLNLWKARFSSDAERLTKNFSRRSRMTLLANTEK